jgi:hypothetical protein
MYRGTQHDGRNIYRCDANRGHLVRDLQRVDAHVEAVTVEALSSPFLVDELTASDEDPTAVKARDRVAELRTTLAELREAWKGHRLSLDAYMDFEADTLRQLQTAEREARTAAPVSDLVLDVAGDGAAAWWEDEATIEQKRAIIRELFTITMLPTPRMGPKFDPQYIAIERRTR